MSRPTTPPWMPRPAAPTGARQPIDAPRVPPTAPRRVSRPTAPTVVGQPAPGACSQEGSAARPVPVALPSVRPVVPDGPITIDCADCAHRNTAVCDDCVVSFIVGRQPDDAVVVDAEEARAVRLLGQAGLVPAVRHSSRAG